MGSAATKQCFESVLCKNKVKPLNRPQSSSKANNSDPITSGKTEQIATTALPTFGEVIDYDSGTIQTSLQRMAWDEPKEFLSDAVNTLGDKGKEAVQEMVSPISEAVSSKWKLLNLESSRHVSTTETPVTPWLLHPDSCQETNKE